MYQQQGLWLLQRPLKGLKICPGSIETWAVCWALHDMQCWACLSGTLSE